MKEALKRVVANVKNADVSSDCRIGVLMYPQAARHPRLVRGPSKDVSSDLRYEKGGKANVTNAVVVNLDSVGSAFAPSIFLSKYGRRKRKCMLSRMFEINNYNTDKC